MISVAEKTMYFRCCAKWNVHNYAALPVTDQSISVRRHPTTSG